MAIEGYDLVMLGILAAAAVLGYFKGVIWQLAWIAGIAASAVVAVRFGGPLAPFFGSQGPWNRLIAMLALYVGTSIAVWLVFGAIAGIIKTVQLSAFDHQMGLLFGLAKGALLCIVVTFFAVMLAPGYRDQIVGSHSGRIVAELIVRSDQFLPPDVIDAVKPFVDRFEDELRRPAATTAAPTATALEAMWDGVRSTSAWTGGTEQGGTAGHPAQPQPSQPSNWQPLPQGHPAAQSTQPGPPVTSGFGQQPASQQPPGQFPVGAQTPILMR
jgi:membrane protein required for colicin V production